MPERRKLSPTRPRASRRIANLLRLAGLRKHREAVAVVISREDVSTPAPEGDRRAVSVETEPVSLYRRRALVAKREAEPIADEDRVRRRRREGANDAGEAICGRHRNVIARANTPRSREQGDCCEGRSGCCERNGPGPHSASSLAAVEFASNLSSRPRS